MGPVLERKRKLRSVAVGAGLGALLGALVLVAHDLVDGARGSGGPPQRARLRQLVAASSAYDDALRLVRASQVVRDALGGRPTAALETCALEDDQQATRLRFTLRLSGPDDHGTLEVRAVFARHEPEPRWRLDEARFVPDATGVGVDLRLPAHAPSH